MIAEEQCCAAALAAIPLWGGRRIRALYERCGSCREVWHLSADELQQLCPGAEKARQSFFDFHQSFDQDAWYRRMEQYDVQIATYWDASYPKLLKETYNPPVVLYYRGDIGAASGKTAAVVGARKATPYGLNAAQTIAEELAREGVTIVSGGARGIDTKAHCGALHADGKTAVVVGHGMDTVYPRENEKLFHQIIENGGVIMTEYAFGMLPLAGNFPARNRIIAGLSRCIIVVEAALKSGSLITADAALEEGRDVFAVPGSIFSSMSRGTNSLLRKGAIALTQSEDVLTEYGWSGEEEKQEKPAYTLTLSEAAVWDTLSCDHAVSQEELVLLTDLTVPQLSAVLLRLQLYGLAEEVQRGSYIKKSGS